jgi:hypothetical protein
VRDADLDDGTVFYLYLPFTGPVLVDVMARLREVASKRTIVVCTLGMDVDQVAPWLIRRTIDSFWLAIYDSRVPGASSRKARERSPLLGPDADTIAFERSAR